LSELQKIITPH